MSALDRGLAIAALVGAAALGVVVAREQRELGELRAHVAELQERVPDQSAIMTVEAFQASNLWFAIEAENWPLAELFINETRKDLRWAARAMPIRKNAEGHDVDVASIAEAIDESQMKAVKDAVLARDRTAAEARYRDMLAGCRACHEAADRAYVRPRVPVAPAVTILGFERE